MQAKQRKAKQQPKAKARSKGQGQKQKTRRPGRSSMFPVPVSQPCGTATTYYGAKKITLALAPGADRLIFITSTGDSSAVCGVVTRATSGGALTFNVFGLSKIATAGTDVVQGPTSGRSQTCEFELTNYSNPLTAGGEILIVPLVQRLGVAAQPSDWNTTNDAFNKIVLQLMDYKAFKPRNLIDFMHVRNPIRFHLSVADRNIFERFESWRTLEPDTPPGFNTFASEFMTWSGLTAQRPRGMNYYAIYIPSVANPQSLNITVRASYYLRWPLNTPLSEMQTTIPVNRGVLPETPMVSQSYVNSTAGLI